MSAAQDQLEIKFRLIDGTDIGPKSFPAATSVATLKENILAQWPKEKDNGPRTVKDVKLISAGRILENSRTVGECRSPLCDIPGGVTTMHVVVQPPAQEKGQLKITKHTSDIHELKHKSLFTSTFCRMFDSFFHCLYDLKFCDIYSFLLRRCFLTKCLVLEFCCWWSREKSIR
ncbi:membrane-anchored ubiquitin-fold protein 2 [Capsicum chacoense]